MLHVKLKPGPPEHRHTLHLMTTMYPGMTAGPRPDTNKSIFLLVLCSFTLFSCRRVTQEQVCILLYRRAGVISEWMWESKYFYRERGGGRMREKRVDNISLTRACWNQWLFDFSLQLSVLLTKNLSTPKKGYGIEQLLGHNCVHFKWGSIAGQTYNINPNTVTIWQHKHSYPDG